MTTLDIKLGLDCQRESPNEGEKEDEIVFDLLQKLHSLQIDKINKQNGYVTIDTENNFISLPRNLSAVEAGLEIKVEELPKDEEDENGTFEQKNNELTGNMLVGRGPYSNSYRDRTGGPSLPYTRPTPSPISDSSSQGSPPAYLPSEERRYSSGGILTVNRNLYSELIDLTITEENRILSEPNRKQYMRMTGGECKVTPVSCPQAASPVYSSGLNATSPLCLSSLNTTSPVCSTALQAASPVCANALSPVNSFSSDSESTVDSILQFEEIHHLYDSTSIATALEPLSEMDKLPPEVKSLINDYDIVSGYEANDKVDNASLDQCVDKILMKISQEPPRNENPIDIRPLSVSEVENFEIVSDEPCMAISPPILSNCISPPVVLSGLQPVMVSEQTIVLVQQTSGVMNQRGRQPRPILPKKDFSSQSMSNNSVSTVEETTISQDNIRKAILAKYTDKDKIDWHCRITKCNDEQLLQVDEDGDTKLHIAIMNGIEVAAVYIIDRFCSSSIRVDLKNINEETPLLCAVDQQLNRLVEYLLCKGANPNLQCNKLGETVLHYAVQRGDKYLSTVETLCKSGKLDMKAHDKLGRTPLILAIEKHDTEQNNCLPIIQCLLQHGASIADTERRSGKTAFHIAIEKQSLIILKMLCRLGQQTMQAINLQNFSGHTPLHFAATMISSEKIQMEIIKLLLDFKACMKVTNHERKTAADLVDPKRKDVKQLLSPRRRSK